MRSGHRTWRQWRHNRSRDKDHISQWKWRLEAEHHEFSPSHFLSSRLEFCFRPALDLININGDHCNKSSSMIIIMYTQYNEPINPLYTWLHYVSVCVDSKVFNYISTEERKTNKTYTSISLLSYQCLFLWCQLVDFLFLYVTTCCYNPL